MKRRLISILSLIAAITLLTMSGYADTSYTVQRGDSLWSIAEAQYGSGKDWRKIYNANQSKIKDPAKIFSGMEFTLPGIDAPEATAAVTSVEDFYNLDGQAAYDMIKESGDSWVVDSYDLVTPENVKDIVVATMTDDTLHFNLAWPPYGGYVPESIASLKDMSGTIEISRIGGNGGCALCYGRNEDGTEFTASQRAIPSSSISYRTGSMDMDKYNAAVDCILTAADDDAAVQALIDAGYDDEIAETMLDNYRAFFTRPEVSGENGIQSILEQNASDVSADYGFYGTAAAWQAGDLNLEGGSTQMTTVFTFGTLIDSGIITDVESANQ